MSDFREHESRSPWNWLGIHYFKAVVDFFSTVAFKVATLFANGTAAAPGIAFESDTDTGIYRYGANDIGFSTSGSVRVRVLDSGITSYGYVVGNTYMSVSAIDGARDNNYVALFQNAEATAGRNYVLYLQGGSNSTDSIIRAKDVSGNEIFRIRGDGNTGFKTASPATVVQVVGDMRMGEATTNYTNFDTTGHQTMAGTAQPWDDLRIEPTARTTGANAPTFAKWYDDAAGTSRGCYLYTFDDVVAGSEKEVFFTMQMPHNWNQDDITIHVHWCGNLDDTTATPRWGLEFVWKEPGAVFGDTTTIYAVGNTESDPNISVGKHYITAFAVQSPGSTQDGLSSILIGRLFRNSSNAADTYNVADNLVGLLYIDAHYQLNSIGSTDEYTK